MYLQQNAVLLALGKQSSDGLSPTAEVLNKDVNVQGFVGWLGCLGFF